MQAYIRNIRSMDRTLWSFSLAWIIIVLGNFGISGVLFNLFVQEMGYNKVDIGRILAVGGLAIGAGALPAGFLGARTGPFKAFALGLLFSMLGWAGVVLVPLLPVDARSITLYSSWSTVHLGMALILVNGAPYFMQVSTKESRIFLVSFQQFLQGIAGAAGSLLAGILPGVFIRLSGGSMSTLSAYTLVLGLLPVLYAVAFTVMWLTKPSVISQAKKTQAAHAGPARFPAGVFAYFILIVLLMSVALGARPFLNLFLSDHGYSTTQIGSLLSILQLMPFVSAASVPLINQRLSLGSLFASGSLLAATGIFLMAFLNTPLAIIAAMFMLGYGLAVYNTLRPLYGQELVEQRWRTYISAGSSTAMAVGTAFISGYGGSLIETSGYTRFFILCAAIALLSSAIMFAYPRLAARLSHPRPVPTPELK